ncbi:HTH_Tnp_Tc3_2 domain-containing protein [Trichonephila clavipes]|nr:HTH_Tnp_Tc3_2 domain-containing protein [Trichonephila clavipes]
MQSPHSGIFHYYSRREKSMHGQCTNGADSLCAYQRSKASGGGQLDEWKWDCRRLMLLDVSMCLVVLSDFGINTNTRFCDTEDLFQVDHELQHLQKTVFYLFRDEGEEPLLCRSSLQTTFKHQEEESRYYGAKSSSGNAGLYARRPVVCVPLNGRQRRNPYAGQENMFLGRSNNGLLCCSQTSPDLQWK